MVEGGERRLGKSKETTLKETSSELSGVSSHVFGACHHQVAAPFQWRSFVSPLGQFQSYSKSSCIEQIKPIRKLPRMGSAQWVVSHLDTSWHCSLACSQRQGAGPCPFLSEAGGCGQACGPAVGCPMRGSSDTWRGRGEVPR